MSIAENPTNPLVNAITQVLPALKGQVFDYANADDFARLWRFKDVEADRIVIVWANTVPDPALSPINAADCLSPVDWAICFAAHREASGQAWPEVLIWDVEPASHARIPSMFLVNALKPGQLPWLQVATDVHLSTIIDWMATPARGNNQQSKAALKRILREIRLDLAEVKSEGTYDRHAISNIIGPMILRGGIAKETLHSIALLQLLRSCGLVDASETNTGPHEVEPDCGNGLCVLLVDDQAHHGWTDWVQGRLPGANVKTLCDPTPLVQEILRQFDAAGTKDLRYRLMLPGQQEGELPVLLLDLRLFSGNAAGELTFHRNILLPLLDRFTDRDDLAWPAFSSTDQKFMDAKNAVTEGSLVVESPEHHEVLTWLPRVLSLIDLSLPIILFSSTGRRSIERTFSPHRNIILGFEKPRFFDVATKSSQVVTNTEACLSRTLEEAGILLRGRMRARQAMQCLKNHVDQRVPERYRHFELFIDESGIGSSLVVGGLVAGFASLENAHAFEDRLVLAGVRYFPTLAGPMPPGDPLPKPRSCRVQFESVVKAWREEGHPLLLCLVTLDGIEPFTTPLRFLDMDFMDNRWRLAVEAVVEVFLSEIVNRLQQKDENGFGASISLYGPTRVSVARSQGEAFGNQARFGTTVQRLDQEGNLPPAWGNNAVAESNLFHTACELLRGHCMSVDLEKAKFVRLQYAPRHCQEWEVRSRDISVVLRSARDFDNDPTEEYEGQLRRVYPHRDEWRAGLRSLHYVCDQLLRDVVWRKAPWSTISDRIPTLHETYDKFLRGNLAASRFLDTNRTIEAMVSWRPHATAQPPWRKGVRKASEAIGARLATQLDSITGEAFMEASSRLRSVMQLSKDVVLPSGPQPMAQKEEAGSPDPVAEEAAAVATRYFVRLDNLPATVTPAGLLDVARRTSFEPVGCEIADDIEEGRHVAAIYFDSESALTQVARALRRRGWQASPFVASELQTVAPAAIDSGNDEDGGENAASHQAETSTSWAGGCQLRVGPIPKSLDPGKVTARINEVFPRAASIHHMGPVRGGGKYVLDFGWPTSTPLNQDYVDCGHERLAVEVVSAADNDMCIDGQATLPCPDENEY